MALFRRSRSVVRRRRSARVLLSLTVLVGASLAMIATVGYVSADHIHDRTGAPMPPPYGNVVIDPYTCFGPGIGYAYGPAPAFTLLRPTFRDLSQRIRYIPASNVEYNGGGYRYGYTDGSNCDRYYGYQEVPGYPQTPPPATQHPGEHPASHPPAAPAGAPFIVSPRPGSDLPPMGGQPGYSVGMPTAGPQSNASITAADALAILADDSLWSAQ